MLTHYGENKFADAIRGVDLVLPVDGWYLGLASAASKSAVTELTGTGYERLLVPRTLTDWCGTQGAGTTLPSTGNSHQISNNNLLDWGEAGSAWGTSAYLLFFDDDTAGNCWAFLPVPPTPIVIAEGDPVTLAIGLLKIKFGATGGMSDYLANKWLDRMWRGEAFTYPASMWAGYSTTATSNSSSGTEPALGGYARVEVESTTDAWSGTQGTGTTSASSGTSGRISNNEEITFPAPTASQGTVGWTIFKDAPTGGNLLWHGPLASAKSVTAGGDPMKFSIDKRGIQFQ